MQSINVEIKLYEEEFRQQILAVWERSVAATHDFLDPTDFIAIKSIVHTIDFKALQVYCLMLNDSVLGFIGVADRKIEMLFLDPQYFGLGLGRKLMDFALTELGADKVDVNEQNSNSVKFYSKMGFETYERTEKDDQGKSYPLLRMKLSEVRKAERDSHLTT